MTRKTGLLLVNLGTPDSAKPEDVKRYLIEFLTDPKVIDYNWPLRQLLVRGLIVPRRYKESARQYKEIWLQDGSPLKVYGERVLEGLRERLGSDFQVEFAMRYQSPTIEAALEKLRDGCDEIIVLPLFPQYAEATTGSVIQKVKDIVIGWNGVPPVRFIHDFPTDEGFIDSLVRRADSYDLGSYDAILFSFHGLPERQLIKSNPSGYCLAQHDCCRKLGEENRYCYAAQCYATAKAMREKLGLSEHRAKVTFQSRLGKDPWIQPFTDKVIEELAADGAKRLLVFCPAFVCDCLETLFEVEREYAEFFRENGGETLELVPGLNDAPDWMDALARLVRLHAHEESKLVGVL